MQMTRTQVRCDRWSTLGSGTIQSRYTAALSSTHRSCSRLSDRPLPSPITHRPPPMTPHPSRLPSLPSLLTLHPHPYPSTSPSPSPSPLPSPSQVWPTVQRWLNSHTLARVVIVSSDPPLAQTDHLTRSQTDHLTPHPNGSLTTDRLAGQTASRLTYHSSLLT